LNKARFDLYISSFFSDFLIGCKTQYLCNSFSSPFFNVDMGIGQGSVLSSIFHIFEKRAKNLKISVSFLLFVNDGLFILQEKSFKKANSLLFCSYNIISLLFEQFGLVIKHEKTKVFHFSRLYGVFNLSQIRGLVLYPKDSW